jgi:predicted metal-dependent hydrolase
MTAALPLRRIAFEYPADLDPAWNRRRPEFAAAANAVSLLMPYAEPYFVRSVRAVYGHLGPAARAEAEAYVRQEAAHHAQHRRFNDLVVARHPALARLERVVARAFRALGRRSERYSMAFAAGSETIAYSLARWTERHLDELFDGADPVPATLFAWHLAEEVEHKTAAFDVYAAVDGSRWRYTHASLLSLALLTFFTWVGTVIQLAGTGRLWSPVAWWRLVHWAVSFGFVLFPTMLVSALPGHHPRDLADPVFLPAWLALYDPATGTLPLYGEYLDHLGGQVERHIASEH